MTERAATQHRDPVCGMRLEEADVQARVEYLGRTYFFCSLACKQKFEQAPHKYAVEGEDLA